MTYRGKLKRDKMLKALLNVGTRLGHKGLEWLEQKYGSGPNPPGSPVLLETVNDLMRSKSEVVIENALLRQQVVILQRSVKRPKVNNTERRLMVTGFS
jgi:hypothetical protein